MPERTEPVTPAQHTFQVNLRGLVDLLSHHLYSSPRVYVRELLQNAIDAITARRQLDHPRQHALDQLDQALGPRQGDHTHKAREPRVERHILQLLEQQRVTVGVAGAGAGVAVRKYTRGEPLL